MRDKKEGKKRKIARKHVIGIRNQRKKNSFIATANVAMVTFFFSGVCAEHDQCRKKILKAKGKIIEAARNG